MLQAWLAHPLTRGLDLNDPQTTSLRRRILKEKRFLRLIYEEWYESLAEELPKGDEPILEIGSGGGFMSDHIPNLITSEVFVCANVDVALSAMQMPFGKDAFRAIVMTGVLHHIPDVRRFFEEATRCLRPGGSIVMIEPWVTSWSRQTYTRLHHEPFEPNARDWHFPSNGPLSDANSALPWILFDRDRAKFQREFPSLEIVSIKPMMPFLYLLSGGLSMRSLMPGWSFKPWCFVERLLQPWMNSWAMFARIVLVKTGESR
jgi:SAM-dependent methyltransferase